MKKNLITRFAVMMITATLTVTTANSLAAAKPVKMSFTARPDTPYLAQVAIMKVGNADTPYLTFNIQPALLRSQLKYLLAEQLGLFYVSVAYINTEGEKLYEDDYYYGDGNDDEIKYD